MALSSGSAASLGANYNPRGAMGGLFAPAYVAGYAPSEAAVMDWQSGRGPTGAEVEQSGMPRASNSVQDTSPWAMGALTGYGGPSGGGGFGMYGPNLADSGPYSFGQPSNVDPAALRAAAQNRPYDIAGRREAVAQQVMANEAAQAESQPDQWGWGGGQSGLVPGTSGGHWNRTSGGDMYVMGERVWQPGDPPVTPHPILEPNVNTGNWR